MCVRVIREISKVFRPNEVEHEGEGMAMLSKKGRMEQRERGWGELSPN